MTPTGESQNAWRKTCPSVTLSTTNPKWTVLGLNAVLCGETGCYWFKNDIMLPYTWYCHRTKFSVFRNPDCSVPVFPVVIPLSLIGRIPVSRQQRLTHNTTDCSRFKLTHIYSYIRAVWRRMPKLKKQWLYFLWFFHAWHSHKSRRNSGQKRCICSYCRTWHIYMNCSCM